MIINLSTFSIGKLTFCSCVIITDRDCFVSDLDSNRQIQKRGKVIEVRLHCIAGEEHVFDSLVTDNARVDSNKDLVVCWFLI